VNNKTLWGTGVSAAAAAMILLAGTAGAATKPKSACAGLEEAVCGTNAACAWTKATTDKNGKARKAYCHAKPGQAAKAGPATTPATATPKTTPPPTKATAPPVNAAPPAAAKTTPPVTTPATGKAATDVAKKKKGPPATDAPAATAPPSGTAPATGAPATK